MNNFLADVAARDMGLGFSSSWVLPLVYDGEGKTPIAAYYTMAHASVEPKAVPAQGKLPPYPQAPVVLLAKMAVDVNYQRQGFGGKTPVAALRNCVQVSDQSLGAIGLILDVLDDDAMAFYQTFGIFTPFTDDPSRLFVPMKTIREI